MSPNDSATRKPPKQRWVAPPFSETVAGLLDRRDERINRIDNEATTVAGMAVTIAVIVAFIVEVAQGEDGMPYSILGAIGGVSPMSRHWSSYASVGDAATQPRNEGEQSAPELLCGQRFLGLGFCRTLSVGSVHEVGGEGQGGCPVGALDR